MPNTRQPVASNTVNPKDAKQADPERIFKAAEAFFQACHLLWAAAEFGFKQVRPVVIATNSALALELYLKCLCVLEHGAFVGKHDAGALFQLLRRQTRQTLEKQWNTLSSDSEWWQRLQDTGDGKLHMAFRLGKDAFVRFRYSFEPEAKGLEWGLGMLVLVVRERILTLHPEWADELTPYFPPKSPNRRNPASSDKEQTGS